jgi:N-acetylglutamate synthase-like GNAT family acetyltransferase
MREEDFDFAVAITDSEGWFLKREDFAFSLELEPEGCFVLFRDSEKIGLVTNVSYGNNIAWLGNLIVDKKYRREGGGCELVEASLSFMHGKGVETVALYAYQDVVSFYLKLGFKADIEFFVMKSKITSSPAKTGFRRAEVDDLAGIIALDGECFGASRRKLLKPIISDSDNVCHVCFEGNKLLGYAVAKPYDGMAELGPLICKRDQGDMVNSLVKAVANDLRGAEMSVVVSSDEQSIVRRLMNLGFREKFRVKRMFHGLVKLDSCVCFAESLERG